MASQRFVVREWTRRVIIDACLFSVLSCLSCGESRAPGAPVRLPWTPTLEEFLPVLRPPEDPPRCRMVSALVNEESRCYQKISLWVFGFRSVCQCCWFPRIFGFACGISWKCGLLATRVGEASRPGPTASLEAHRSMSQVSPEVVPYACAPNLDSSVVSASSIPAPPLSVPGSASLRRPAPMDSAQAPNSKRHASSAGRWHCQVHSCPGALSTQ